jgi:hypothetical protein
LDKALDFEGRTMAAMAAGQHRIKTDQREKKEERRR